MVKLCFLVNVRKATGRNVEGGKEIGRIETALETVLGFLLRIGKFGVLNAGEDEGTSSADGKLFLDML